MSKSTVYIDVEDEITAIIDKLKAAPENVVALVLPKRATVLQSAVNMKLLKRAAGTSKKNIVLITNEPSLLMLAGSVGLHVAETLSTKPRIPEKETDDEAGEEILDKDDKSSKTVGELSAAAAAPEPSIDSDETINYDELGEPDEEIEGKDSKPHNKKLKVPNFDSFRKRIFIGIAAILLLIGAWFYGFVVMPKATISISTEQTSIASDIDFTADTALTEPKEDKTIIPAKTDRKSVV